MSDSELFAKLNEYKKNIEAIADSSFDTLTGPGANYARQCASKNLKFYKEVVSAVGNELISRGHKVDLSILDKNIYLY